MSIPTAHYELSEPEDIVDLEGNVIGHTLPELVLVEDDAPLPSYVKAVAHTTRSTDGFAAKVDEAVALRRFQREMDEWNAKAAANGSPYRLRWVPERGVSGPDTGR